MPSSEDQCELCFIGPSGEIASVGESQRISSENLEDPVMYDILSKTDFSYDFSIIPMSLGSTYGDTKEQALKILEEAAEVVAAWKERLNDNDWMNLAEECGDVIQSTVNLLYSCGIPPLALKVALAKVMDKNLARGRKYITNIKL